MAKRGAVSPYPILEPNLQVAFYYRLQAIRRLYLGEALRDTVGRLEVAGLDLELAALVRADALSKTASFGLRGEIFFAIPCMLRANPHLLGYYRLLLGLSQKEFYAKGPFGRFKRMEELGEASAVASEGIPRLCDSLIGSAELLVKGLDSLSLDTVNELQLLTLGPQLRGSENTRIGQRATQKVFDMLKDTMGKYVMESTRKTIIVRNRSGRNVLIEFASDPDVAISEKLPSGMRPLISIEVKGGADASNIHNRLGEAEKSHQKAKQRGFAELWTIIRVVIDPAEAHRESPTTTHFFNLDTLLSGCGAEARRFRETLCSSVGIPV